MLRSSVIAFQRFCLPSLFSSFSTWNAVSALWHLFLSFFFSTDKQNRWSYRRALWPQTIYRLMSLNKFSSTTNLESNRAHQQTRLRCRSHSFVSIIFHFIILFFFYEHFNGSSWSSGIGYILIMKFTLSASISRGIGHVQQKSPTAIIAFFFNDMKMRMTHAFVMQNHMQKKQRVKRTDEGTNNRR